MNWLKDIAAFFLFLLFGVAVVLLKKKLTGQF